MPVSHFDLTTPSQKSLTINWLPCPVLEHSTYILNISTLNDEFFTGNVPSCITRLFNIHAYCTMHTALKPDVLPPCVPPGSCTGNTMNGQLVIPLVGNWSFKQYFFATATDKICVLGVLPFLGKKHSPVAYCALNKQINFKFLIVQRNAAQNALIICHFYFLFTGRSKKLFILK